MERGDGRGEKKERARGKTERVRKRENGESGRGRLGRVEEGGTQWGRGEKKACERKDRE